MLRLIYTAEVFLLLYAYLNTSHVEVNQTDIEVLSKVKANLNTSHVEVNRIFKTSFAALVIII